MGANAKGQILLPALLMVFLFTGLATSYLTWSFRLMRQMRLEMAADATALSAARAQAGMLNTLAMTNAGVNLFLQKADLPRRKDAVGVMRVSAVPAFTQWKKLLKAQVWGFKTFPAGVGQSVSRLNGAEGRAIYFPAPMDAYLRPQNVHVGIVLQHPPFLIYRYVPDAFYVRAWRPAERKAQPPHKTTWWLRQGSLKAVASAGLWLDLDSRSALHNGGFARDEDRGWGGILIQSFYPQFNARLLSRLRKAA